MSNKDNLEQLKEYGRSECKVCGNKYSYMSPNHRCDECKDKFCSDHIKGGQYSPERMERTDEARDVCEECGEKHNYRSI